MNIFDNETDIHDPVEMMMMIFHVYFVHTCEHHSRSSLVVRELASFASGLGSISQLVRKLFRP
uniref:Uncharacterized protein n=1 Tax=Arion vulgaris TaxID=1028688 RepID=A0A0B7AJ16_9EUPU